MSDDYLWDRSGTPDPEVERLETLLSRYALAADVPAKPRRARWPIAVAAALIVAIGIGVFALRFRWGTNEAWPIAGFAGTPTINGRPLTRDARFGIGDELRTDAHSSVVVEIARVGELSVAPNSTVTLMQTRGGRHRVRLDRGHVSARVWAPPFTFSVHTPAGLASDVGCAFDLRYDGGTGEVRVTSGWVDFDGETREAMIPAGAVAELSDQNPGSPYYADATPAFRNALRAYDRGTGPIAPLLAAARPRDAMTLLHLLERAPRADRGPLFDTLVRLAPPPLGVSRDGVIARDVEMLGDWRRSLGLGTAKRWWLHWRDAL